jgi:hypothetical protein
MIRRCSEIGIGTGRESRASDVYRAGELTLVQQSSPTAFMEFASQLSPAGRSTVIDRNQ